MSEPMTPEDLWTRKDRRRIAALDRRARFLEQREGGDRDEAEAAAIRWALRTLDIFAARASASTPDPDAEAALDALDEWKPSSRDSVAYLRWLQAKQKVRAALAARASANG